MPSLIPSCLPSYLLSDMVSFLLFLLSVFFYLSLCLVRVRIICFGKWNSFLNLLTACLVISYGFAMDSLWIRCYESTVMDSLLWIRCYESTAMSSRS